MATAFAALVSLQNNLRLILNHTRHSFSFEFEQIKSLWNCVRFLIKFMKSFDNSNGAIKEAAEALERRIARAAQAAEDVIESYVVDQIRSGSTLGGKTKSRFLLDLQKAIDDMDFVRRKAVNVQKSQQPTFSVSAATTSSTSLTVGSAESNRMVGFDDELLRLLDLLTGVPSSRRLIPIVGMGGIEKEKASLLSKISTSVDELGEELYKSLFGRRYLIILDDMWSVEAWDKMKFFFPDTSNGSRIAVTTRQSDVARHFGPLHLRVKFLEEDSSWDLFCSKTFGEEGCPHVLEDIGKKIVGKCGGLPLAIVVVGGHLRKSSRTPEYWESVANHMNSVLDSEDPNESCLNILSLSYRYLPVHLKPCFLFLGVFPEDQQIPLFDIVNLWIAEGFIEHFEGSSLEYVAWLYLDELVERNLISFAQKFWIYGNDYTFRIHDLLRELCLKIAKKDEFLYVLDIPRAINKEHRILINGRIPEVDHQQKIFHAPRSQPLVRSVMCEGGQLSFDLKLLRVLNKVDETLVNEFDFQQVNLRHLKVNVDYKSYLPPSISLLWNLQTLIITGAFRSIIAPYEIWEMLQLRHIEVDPICLPDPLPIESLDQENDLVLRNLLRLSKVENFWLSEEVCRRIPNIATLELSYCDEPSSNYCLHNLGCFQELESLKCYFDGNANWRDYAVSLTFPSSLRRLSLRGSRLDWEALTMMVGSLPYLENLVLFKHSVIGSVWTPVEGGFPCLKELTIFYCGDLFDWNVEESHFPALEDVGFEGLSKLDEFPPRIGEIPTLKNIYLVDCSMSSTFSAMRMVVEQEEQGIEGPQLYVRVNGDEETLESFKQKVEEDGLRSKNIHLELRNVKTMGS